MLTSSRAASRGVGALVARSGRSLASSALGVPVESSCSKVTPPLPGVYRERQWTWDHSTNGSSDIQVMRSETELLELVASTPPDSLVVVKYSAVLCDACKAVQGKFQETAAEFGGLGKSGQGKVLFAEISFDSNRQLCDKMGIQSVPHVQIFTGSNGKIADFSIAPLKYHTLTSLLEERRHSGDSDK